MMAVEVSSCMNEKGVFYFTVLEQDVPVTHVPPQQGPRQGGYCQLSDVPAQRRLVRHLHRHSHTSRLSQGLSCR